MNSYSSWLRHWMQNICVKNCLSRGDKSDEWPQGKVPVMEGRNSGWIKNPPPQKVDTASNSHLSFQLASIWKQQLWGQFNKNWLTTLRVRCDVGKWSMTTNMRPLSYRDLVSLLSEMKCKWEICSVNYHCQHMFHQIPVAIKCKIMLLSHSNSHILTWSFLSAGSLRTTRWMRSNASLRCLQ